MRWFTSIMVVLAMLAGGVAVASGSAAPAAVVATAHHGPAMESACDGCRKIVADCIAPTCEVPGVFARESGAGTAPVARIARPVAGGTGSPGLDHSPSPPPPRV